MHMPGAPCLTPRLTPRPPARRRRAAPRRGGGRAPVVERQEGPPARRQARGLHGHALAQAADHAARQECVQRLAQARRLRVRRRRHLRRPAGLGLRSAAGSARSRAGGERPACGGSLACRRLHQARQRWQASSAQTAKPRARPLLLGGAAWAAHSKRCARRMHCRGCLPSSQARAGALGALGRGRARPQALLELRVAPEPTEAGAHTERWCVRCRQRQECLSPSTAPAGSVWQRVSGIKATMWAVRPARPSTEAGARALRWCARCEQLQCMYPAALCARGRRLTRALGLGCAVSQPRGHARVERKYTRDHP